MRSKASSSAEGLMVSGNWPVWKLRLVSARREKLRGVWLDSNGPVFGVGLELGGEELEDTGLGVEEFRVEGLRGTELEGKELEGVGLGGEELSGVGGLSGEGLGGPKICGSETCAEELMVTEFGAFRGDFEVSLAWRILNIGVYVFVGKGVPISLTID